MTATPHGREDRATTAARCCDRLVLVRHGEVAPEWQGCYLGRTDVPLSQRGEDQAQRLIQPLTPWRPQHLMVSPLRRARETAQVVAPHLALSPVIVPELAEIHFGRWEGRCFEQIAEQDPAWVRRWGEFADDFAFPDGEAVADFAARVRSALVQTRQVEGTVVWITHGGVIRLALCHLLGRPWRDYLSFTVPRGSISVIDLNKPQHAARCIGRTAHLEEL